MGNQNPYIEEEQTTQWTKEKVYFKKDAKAAMVNVFLLVKLKSSLQKFYGRHHELADHCGISVSQMTMDNNFQWNTVLFCKII
jgi:hypothetical protein